MPTTRIRRLNIADAKVGDEVRHEGDTVTILHIEMSSDRYHWRVTLSCSPSRPTIFPSGCTFTQPTTQG